MCCKYANCIINPLNLFGSVYLLVKIQVLWLNSHDSGCFLDIFPRTAIVPHLEQRARVVNVSASSPEPASSELPLSRITG